MPQLVVPGAMQVRLIWSLPGGTIGLNVLGAIKQAAIPGQALADSLGAGIKTAFTASGWAPHVSEQIALQTVGVRDISTASQLEYLDTGAPVPGTAVDDPLPGEVALVITLRTAKAGQSGRGRVYLLGLTEVANLASGQADPGIAVFGVNFIQSVIGAFQTSGLRMAVISRPSLLTTITTDVTLPDGSHSTTVKIEKARGGGFTEVIGVELRNSVWDSQRRRQLAGSQSSLLRPIAKVSVQG
jgi:hypothetical protein